MARREAQARDRIIGARLRAIRTERVKLPLERAAEIAQWSAAKLSRTERGLRHVATDEVATLITAWGLPAAERDKVLAEVQAEASAIWWDRPLPGLPPSAGAMGSYEADAHELVSVAPSGVPGLLQTRETAIAMMLADAMSPEDVEINWMARLRRQQILGKVDYSAFIAESVLWMPYGGGQALRGQLEHLLRAQDRGITIRIVPTRQTDVLILHSWERMRFPHAEPVVRVELSAGGAFYIHGEDAKPYDAVLARLDRVALSQGTSRARIAELARAPMGSAGDRRRDRV